VVVQPDVNHSIHNSFVYDFFPPNPKEIQVFEVAGNLIITVGNKSHSEAMTVNSHYYDYQFGQMKSFPILGRYQF
jgi:hypothetical protein